MADKKQEQCTIPDVRRSAYEKGLHSKIREINNDTQLLLERWDELKDLEFSSEHRGLFNAMKEFIEVHCA